jgi:hypothetical protein
MRTTLFSLAVTAGLSACSDAGEQRSPLEPTDAPTSAVVEQQRVLVENTAPNDCTGELIDFRGIFHFTTRETISANGRLHVGVHQNLQGVSGVGQTTGQVYREVGASSDKANAADFEGRPPFEATVVAHGAFVGPGPGNNLTLKITSHFVVNARGVLTVAISRVETQCR